MLINLDLSDSGAKAPFYLGRELTKQAKFPSAAKEFSRASWAGIEKAILQSKPSWVNMDWPERGYIDNDEHRFVYCPISKVACSSFKKLAVQLSNISYKEEILQLPPPLFHSYVDHSLTFFAKYRSKRKLSEEILNSKNYFKFAIVRNPWDRLVSAYLNKFITPPDLEKSTSPGIAVIKEFYAEKELTPDFNQALTFREFVEYVSIREDTNLDGHWQSQVAFLNGHEFDYIGKFEKMGEAFETIQECLKVNAELPWANKSNRRDHQKKEISSPTLCSDLNRAELKQLKYFPGYQSFYTPDLIELVGNRYQDDVEKFAYDF